MPNSTVPGALAVQPLDPSTWPAFARLVEANNGVFGGCWCMGMHPDDGDPGLPKRERKLERVRAGTAHAALVFDGDDCLGWVQFGPPAEVARIKNRAAYEKEATAAPDWRIGCHFVGKGHRRRGVAAAGLAGALELIAGLGGGVVEGYPEPAGAVPAGFLYHGALSTFEQLGFQRDRPIGKHRWVVRTVVPPRGRNRGMSEDDGPQVVRTMEVATAVIRAEVPTGELPGFFDRAITELPRVLAGQGVRPVSAAFALYRRPPAATADVEVGFVVDAEVRPEGDVLPGRLPGGRVVRAVHAGGFDGLGAAWQRLFAWAQEHGHAPDGLSWEVYLTQPSPEMDPADLRTELDLLLAEPVTRRGG